MAHELRNVNDMVFTGSTPWHGLGVSLDKDTPFAEWFRPIDFQVNKEQLFDADMKAVDYFCTRRADTREVLGYVGPDYTLLQNRDAFDFFAPFVESKLCTMETVGSLRGGSRIWALAKIAGAETEIVKGDPIEAYFMLSNSHDGKWSVKVGFTPVRVVCANTVAAAHSSKSSRLIRIRHGKDVKTNLDEMAKVIDLANQEFVATAEQMRLLASKGVNRFDMEKFFRVALGNR